MGFLWVRRESRWYCIGYTSFLDLNKIWIRFHSCRWVSYLRLPTPNSRKRWLYQVMVHFWAPSWTVVAAYAFLYGRKCFLASCCIEIISSSVSFLVAFAFSAMLVFSARFWVSDFDKEFSYPCSFNDACTISSGYHGNWIKLKVFFSSRLCAHVVWHSSSDIQTTQKHCLSCYTSLAMGCKDDGVYTQRRLQPTMTFGTPELIVHNQCQLSPEVMVLGNYYGPRGVSRELYFLLTHTLGRRTSEGFILEYVPPNQYTNINRSAQI